MDAVVLAVAHNVFCDWSEQELGKFYKTQNREKVLMDIKGILDREKMSEAGYLYWRL